MNKDHVVVGFLSGTSIVLVCLSALFGSDVCPDR